MPVHDRDSSSKRSTINGTGSSKLGTLDVTNFWSETLAVISNDKHSVKDRRITLKRVHDTEQDISPKSRFKCKIPKLYNYDTI